MFSVDVKSLTEKVDFLTFKKELNQVVESVVNKAMIKKVWHNWQTLLIVIALVSLHLFLTMHFSQRDFERLEKKVAGLAIFTKNPDNIK